MDEFNIQNNPILKKNTDKKGLILGLIASLFLLGISYVLGFVIFITPFGLVLGFILSYIIPLFLYPLVDFLIPTPLFLIINSLFLFFSRKSSGFKRGIKIGFLFLLIFIAVIIFRYLVMFSLWHDADIERAKQKLIGNGDVTICDKMTVKEGWEDQVPSSKDIKESCYTEVVNWAVKTNDILNCDKLINNLPSFNSCILQIARNTKNLQVCDKLKTDTLIKNCYLMIQK